MSTAVQEILERIRHLPESEQFELRNELAREDEDEWACLVVQAREEASRRGLDDEQIAATVESLRYGNGRPG